MALCANTSVAQHYIYIYKSTHTKSSAKTPCLVSLLGSSTQGSRVLESWYNYSQHLPPKFSSEKEEGMKERWARNGSRSWPSCPPHPLTFNWPEKYEISPSEARGLSNAMQIMIFLFMIYRLLCYKTYIEKAIVSFPHDTFKTIHCPTKILYKIIDFILPFIRC